MNTPQKFVIIAQPRSGSYYFQSLLDSAHDIVCHGEIFKLDRVELSTWYQRRMGVGKNNTQLRDLKPFRFLERLRGLNPKKIFGFKAFWEHLTPHAPLLDHVVNDPDWKKLFLVRNPVQSYASLLRARKTNKWTKRKSQPVDEAQDRYVVVHFDGPEFEKHYANYRWYINKNNKLMETQALSCLEIGYADLRDPAKINKVLEFLGSAAAASDLDSSYSKQYAGDISEAFDNYDEMIEHLGRMNLVEAINTQNDIFSPI